MTIGTKAMQPDYRSIGGMHTGLDYQGFVSHFESHTKQRPAL
jgi:hypothetical protein